MTTTTGTSKFLILHESMMELPSKINERFQALMDIIPQNDQKRDKASFFLEVIEHIHFLQEKVQMYEGSHQMWYQAPTKLIPWRNNHEAVAGEYETPTAEMLFSPTFQWNRLMEELLMAEK